MPLQLNSSKHGVVWNGSFFVHHSLALVNRELTLALLQEPAFADRYDLSISQHEPPTFGAEADPRFAALQERMNRVTAEVDVTVRHRYPPEFTAPRTGRLAVIQPWEFGSLPAAWAPAFRSRVDEVWVPSSYVRECYINSGVPGDKVVVVPNGVNTNRFHPGVVPYDLSANPLTADIGPDTYKFLFVGGTIARKGIDVLLDAFDRAFTAKDDVVLIIKDFGTQTFYANQGAGEIIRALQDKQGGAKLVYLNEDMTEEQIAGLYAACDCLVHPYRGEGYGLPIAEAMACGKPTLVTNYGAALDFAHSGNAYLIPATVQHHTQKRIGDIITLDFPYWADPDRDALTSLLRHVMTNRDEAHDRGVRAAEEIQARHTWAEAARIAADRLVALADGVTSSQATGIFTLPMGLGNINLGGLSLSGASSLSALGDMYEDRKQAALAETRTHNWTDAIDELESLLIERPEDWDVVNALAVAYYCTDQVEKAVQLLRQGLERAPESRDFHHNLAFILQAAGRTSEALEHAEFALQITPGDPSVLQTMEAARDAVLKQARKILRSYPDKQRNAAKQNPEYVELMRAYRRAEAALEQAAALRANAASTISNSAAVPDADDPPRLSLCMIVKNEERFLRNCLESAKSVVDEIVIVDTGSTDSTLDIAREYGAIIVEHAWNDDFAEARNVSLEHATGNWALWLDADEELAPGAGPAFRQAIAEAPATIGAYLIKFHNWLSNTPRKEGSEMAVHHACRLFRRVPGVRFQGRIHEQNLPSLQALGYGYTKKEGMVIDHFGYTGEIMSQRNKHERFIRMLIREVEECPDEMFRLFHLFNLGNAYYTFGDMENAALYFSKAADQISIEEEYAVTLYVEWATALHRLSRPQEGLEVCEQADALGIRQAGIEFARGYCLLHLERYEEAEESFQMALQYGQGDQGVYAESGDAGASSYKARYGLGLALVGQDRYEEAILCLEETLEEQPNMVEARYLLSVALTREDRKVEAYEALETILSVMPNHEDAIHDLSALLFENEDYETALPYVRSDALRDFSDYQAQARLAVCCEKLGLFEEARDAYEQLRLLAPESAEVCVNLGRVLAATGSDAEAIDCFADAIQMAPDYANAYFNAGDLLYSLRYYDRAAETYMAGLEIAPEHEAGFFVLGNCYFHTQDFAAAAMSYRQALVMDPAHREALNNLQLVEELLIQQQAA
jgi:tetratricopeptide (TPR) repeat protein